MTNDQKKQIEELWMLGSIQACIKKFQLEEYRLLSRILKDGEVDKIDSLNVMYEYQRPFFEFKAVDDILFNRAIIIKSLEWIEKEAEEYQMGSFLLDLYNVMRVNSTLFFRTLSEILLSIGKPEEGNQARYFTEKAAKSLGLEVPDIFNEQKKD